MHKDKPTQNEHDDGLGSFVGDHSCCLWNRLIRFLRGRRCGSRVGDTRVVAGVVVDAAAVGADVSATSDHG